ncbi:hypothetical protein KDA_35560 [Dictyobacter alpinus]|uniref:HTH tetR-type domain-containing protein n=1 Tax=Dictyobacter alpinus TaxID=2014873 RepID=A0A402B9U4_9CHLR|nr:TetR/AcrR family transcriptional regulator [Dictyobacter alpinus]GCE28072.1 hypothetical protein KDA_35560 [Dictyobacter alpinus]
MKRKRSESTTRLSAQERREHILEVALPVFATYGLHGASTLTIAEHAGISETYIFRLFGTKKELFLAVVEHVHTHVMTLYRSVLENHPVHPLEAIQAAMKSAVSRDELLLLLQAYVACHDEDIQRIINQRFREMYTYVSQQVNMPQEVQTFFAYSMFSMILMAIGISDLSMLSEQQLPNTHKES